MTVAFTNFASTTIQGALTTLSTSITVATTTGANFPATAGNKWFYIVLTDSLVSPTVREVIKVTTRSGDNFSVCVRARDGTTAQNWPSGTYCQLRLTMGTFADLDVQYANNADNLSNLASAATARTNLGLGSIATQAASAVAITGGTITGTPISGSTVQGAIGGITPSTVAATTISASGVITSTQATGTAPFTIASTTVVGNLNVSQLLGATWTAPGTIGSVTPSSGAFTTLSASGAVSGVGFSNYLAAPPAIGGSSPAAGTFTAIVGTTIRATTYINYRGGDNASQTNSGFGETALDSNAGGTANTAVGYGALTANTTGSNNVAVGYGSMINSTTAGANVAIGGTSLASLQVGNNNIAIGYAAGNGIGASVVAGNFVIGQTYTITSSGTTVFTAVGAANNNVGTVFVATGIGAGTGTACSSTSNNIAMGSYALSVNTTGTFNVAIGNNALLNNLIARDNVAIGDAAMQTNISGATNVAVGTSALLVAGTARVAGSFTVGVSYTIYSTGSTDFTLIGAANSNVGTVFTATGVGAGTGVASANANNNVAVGYLALSAATHPSSNTAVGANAFLNVTTGGSNTAYGSGVGATLTTGTNNTLVGASANVTAATQTNSTAIGYQATATLDNQVVLGNASVTEYKLPATSGHVKYAGSYSSGAPVTETAATHTVALSTSSLIGNRAGTITVTLPSAATYTGRELRIKTITANTIVSNASNVVPLIGGAAGTAICAGVAGSWAHLHSDGTNWIIMAGA